MDTPYPLNLTSQVGKPVSKVPSVGQQWTVDLVKSQLGKWNKLAAGPGVLTAAPREHAWARAEGGGPRDALPFLQTPPQIGRRMMPFVVSLDQQGSVIMEECGDGCQLPTEGA